MAGSDTIRKLDLRMQELWGSDSAGTPESTRPPEPKRLHLATVAPALEDHFAGAPRQVALEKVKAQSAAVSAHMRATLAAQGLEMPQLPFVPSKVRRTDGNNTNWLYGDRSTAVSHLSFAEGPRLLMSQSLAAGSYGKFRIGMWESQDPSVPSAMVALKELCLTSYPHMADRRPLNRLRHFTAMDVAEREVNLLMEPFSPMQLRGVVRHKDNLYLCLPLLEMDLLRANALVEQRGHDTDIEFLLHMGAQVMHDVAASLAPMHAASVGHFDLKPDNVFLDARGHAKVGDVGLAKRLTRPDENVSAGGTVGYFAPEALKTRKQGLPADAWSLSVTVCNFVLGRGIFAFETDTKGRAASGMHEFLKFRASLARRDDGTIDLDAACVGRDFWHWRNTFASLRDVSPELAAFMLDRGLHPDPRQRATIAEIKTFAARLLADAGIEAEAETTPLSVLTDPQAHAEARARLTAYAAALRATGE